MIKRNPRARIVIRFCLALYILLVGVSLLPHVGFSAERLGWEQFAGLYQPQVDLVGKGSGAPGSAFRFSAAGYPANAWATVYVNGISSGVVRINSQGELAFLVQSRTSAGEGMYLVTLAVDATISATDSLSIDSDEPIIRAPNRWSGPTLSLIPGPTGSDYLPD